VLLGVVVPLFTTLELLHEGRVTNPAAMTKRKNKLSNFLRRLPAVPNPAITTKGNGTRSAKNVRVRARAAEAVTVVPLLVTPAVLTVRVVVAVAPLVMITGSGLKEHTGEGSTRGVMVLHPRVTVPE
jgi:hypothetical protein